MRYQFVDCRWELGRPGRGRELYLERHIPGASFLDVEHELSAAPGAPPHHGGRHPLPDEGHFARWAGHAGIGAGVFVVAYDQGRSGGAARLWWLLRHFGHDDAAVLDGGLDAWLGPVHSGEEAVEQARFVPRPRHDDTIDAEELERRLREPGLVLVDARAPERYRGEVEPIDPVPGRIPGAINVPYTRREPVADTFAPTDEVVVYCGSGVTACVTALDLVRAGHERVRLYPGSWSDWSARGLPAERGNG